MNAEQRNSSQENAETEETGYTPLPVVGLGASAGGVRALQTFFRHMPADSGNAFVVIMHLSPEHESALPAILQQETEMPVAAVTEPMQLEVNHVYIIPPNQSLALTDGWLRLSERLRSDGQPVAIDLFLRTLAESHGEEAIGVILSGSGSDGASGIARVKERGGLTIAQKPDEAEYDGMPQNAIATGMIDRVLAVAAMPDAILTYRDSRHEISLPEDAPARDSEAELLREIFALLRVRTGHDFSSYKRSTILRRIGRRMQVHGVTELAAYVRVLREQPGEVQALLRDLLISVTNFFRDREAFAALEQDLANIFAGKQADDQVRVWVAGCATGEEAYSVAILLAEYAALLERPPEIQVFATDVDSDAIAVAREGVYLPNIAADVAPERLQRFFDEEQGRYRIKKEIRDRVLFAVHNVLHDPPFSRLDLLTCRNLLIYLDRDLQERLLELFHFVLRPDGRLMLGVAESAEVLPNLYTVVDKKWRIYARRSVARTVAALPDIVRRTPEQPRRLVGGGASPEREMALGELHQQLLEAYAPPSLIVNDTYDIVHLSERVGRYLMLGGGEPSYNLLRVVHPELRLELRTALFRAVQNEQTVETRPVALQIDGQPMRIAMRVHPVRKPVGARGFLLVMFSETSDIANGASSMPEDAQAEPIVRQLDAELQRMRDELRATSEQYETSTEELKASNEELQAINEELRSTSEELETSKEELQSVNEELTTVNFELKSKVDELSRANSDLQNLMSSTDIGTLFVDRELRIKRYTPRIQELFNLIVSDVNRPLAHLTHRLRYEKLLDDAAQVLNRLAVIEREVQTLDGQWFMVRLGPYRTLDDRIDGVVLTFVDITERKRAENEWRRLLAENQRQSELLRELIDNLPVPVVLFAGPEHRFSLVNGEYARLARSRGPLIGRTLAQVWPLAAQTLLPLFDQVYATGEAYSAVDLPIEIEGREGVQTAYYNFSLLCWRNAEGEPEGVLFSGYDTTERVRSQQEIETLVALRTAELEAANKSLQAESAERRNAEAGRLALLRRLVTVEEEERKRISRELHDQAGQQLTALLLGLQALKDESYGREQALQKIEQLREIADTLAQSTHQLARQLRPPALDELGLAAAVAGYAEEWSQRTGVAVDANIGVERAGGLSHEAEIVLYRVVQEALMNIAKHAAARRVSLILERRNNHVTAIIEDDGNGFDVEAVMQTPRPGDRLGLLGMQERVGLVDGTLIVESRSGGGTTVFVRIPVVDAAAEPAHD